MPRNESGKGPFWPVQPANGTVGTALKLASNFFQMSCDKKEKLYAYDVKFEPELGSVSNLIRAKVELAANSVTGAYAPFFRKGNRMYSRVVLEDQEEQLTGIVDEFEKEVVILMRITRSAGDSFEVQVGSREMSMLFKHIVNKLAGFKRHQRLGDLYYTKTAKEDDKHQIISGFTCRVNYIAEVGHHLTVDTMYRAIHRKNVLDSMLSNIDYLMSESMVPPTQNDINAEWTRRCENAIAVAFNNGRIYRIKRVRFDLHPCSTFVLKDRKSVV